MFPAHDDETTRRWAAETELTGASPGAARDLIEMNVDVDAREALSRVEAPAVVLHHRDDKVIRVENGRAVAAALRDARYVELPGSDHVFLFEDRDALLAAIRDLSASRSRGSAGGRG